MLGNIRNLLLFFLVVFLSLHAETERKKTICVNMIIKNEHHVIERCLGSLKGIIDYWVIVDTGSTDGTQEIVKNFMKDKPGELHERPWVNFSHNRNEALDLAKGKADYILFIDADEVLKFDPDFKMPALTKDGYYMTTRLGETSYHRLALIKDGLDWRWEGVVHEVLVSPTHHAIDVILGVYNHPTPDGASWSDPEKYLKHAKLLEADFARDPTNARTAFYTAQSYRDYGDKAKALEWYTKRIALGGWDEEVFWSMVQVAMLQEDLKYPDHMIETSWFSAQRYRPSRVEPDYYLASHYRMKGDYKLGAFIAKRGMQKPRSKDSLFIQDWVYNYGLLFEYSICTYWTGEYEESRKACEELLKRQLPDNYRKQVLANYEFVKEKIEQQKYFTELTELIKESKKEAEQRPTGTEGA